MKKDTKSYGSRIIVTYQEKQTIAAEKSRSNYDAAF